MIDADLVIPSGEVFQKLLASGIKKIHRDPIYASLGLGRYALGLIWYATLTGNDIERNMFCDFDEEISKAEVEIAKNVLQKFSAIKLTAFDMWCDIFWVSSANFCP